MTVEIALQIDYINNNKNNKKKTRTSKMSVTHVAADFSVFLQKRKLLQKKGHFFQT